MRRSTFWRTLLSVSVALPVATHAIPSSSSRADGGNAVPPLSLQHQGGLSPDEVQRLSHNADQHVIVLLRDQHASLAVRGATGLSRAAAMASDQQSILSELAGLHAPHVRSFHVINAIAATVSAAEEARLRSNGQVRAVVPDLVIQGPSVAARDAARSAATTASGSSGTAKAAAANFSPLPLRMSAARVALPSSSPASGGAFPSPCTSGVSVEPQALGLTNALQAQSVVTGTGVTIAFLADGVDVNNPEFFRSDGSSVFADYQDFSGDGTNTPTGGAQAFGAASLIAAQGRFIYDVSKPYTTTPGPYQLAGVFVNPAFNGPSVHCRIKIQGLAPGASLVGLKVFGQQNQTTTSNIVQAIQYAVANKVDVLSQAFGRDPYPDNANDPIAQADDAAVAAGVTVIAGSGDSGTAGTLRSPSTDPNVIETGATTEFRQYAETVSSGIQLSSGIADDNISSLSSGGFSQNGTRTLDLAAPGDASWAVCAPDPATYSDCHDAQGGHNPAAVETFGGTSAAAPLTAAAAALVIQAYRQSHGGANPLPALVKEILKSTAHDLIAPSSEQGSGLLDVYKAVQAALSYQDTNGGSATPQGNALLVSPDALAVTGAPGTTRTFRVLVTNTGAQTQTVQPAARVLGGPIAGSSQSFSPAIGDPATDPNTHVFTDANGIARPYVTQPFTVPVGAQRLDAAISFDEVHQQTVVAMFLLDPQGRYTAYTRPQFQGQGGYTPSGYGHVDVANPLAGTWTAIVFSRPSQGLPDYRGTVHLDVSSSAFAPLGSVAAAAQTLAPGQTGTFAVVLTTPAQPGDENADLAFTDAGGNSTAGVVPISLRSTVPLGATGGSFQETLTGGNSHPGPGQELTYQFDVPAALKDLDLNLALADNNYNLEGILVDPNGLPIDVQSTKTTAGGYTNTMQFFRRDPQAGRWTFLLLINANTSGQQTSLRFQTNIQFNGVHVSAPGAPQDAATTLAQGVPVTIPIIINNAGNTAKDFFVDPRLTTIMPLSLGGFTQTVPLTAGQPASQFFVPSESTDLSIVAESAAARLSMDAYNGNGAAPFGQTGSPDLGATSFAIGPPLVPSSVYAAVASTSAPEVVPGSWFAVPQEVGPYGASVTTPTTVQLGASVHTQQFDPAAVPATGDAYAALAGQTTPDAFYAPRTIQPLGQDTVNVVITPTGSVGGVVSGLLYVDAFNVGSAPVGMTGVPNLTTGIGDELVAIPYTYTIGAAPTATPTNTSTNTATSTATNTVSPTATATNTISPTVTGTPGTPAATNTAAAATATPTPTNTATSTAAAATNTAVPVTATATATATAVANTATNTAVPATATRTAAAANTATNTAAANTATDTSVPATATNTAAAATATATATNTAVPSTATSTAVAATATNTAVANTATNTAVPATATGTTTPVATATTHAFVAVPRRPAAITAPIVRPAPVLATLTRLNTQAACFIQAAVFPRQGRLRSLTVSGLRGDAHGASSYTPLVYDDGHGLSFTAQRHFAAVRCGVTTVLRAQGRVARAVRGRLAANDPFTLTVTREKRGKATSRYSVLLVMHGIKESLSGLAGRISFGLIHTRAPGSGVQPRVRARAHHRRHA